jgi:hypothetical protein
MTQNTEIIEPDFFIAPDFFGAGKKNDHQNGRWGEKI